ncbi:MAG: penicillin-binding transpeptidase domain-containing protein [Candidatus Shapirobacteria bacterium]|nr:penicillin-binding transpeptidase domain-containing protein [Candidatus Shapirobacteria bacterium]MDD5073900.1 penicillin-binding transpeptidase domain-containing protein [Candidatus Shapirobacteria bacterium]MDD5481494.1 penicillin-binding transpeptidase domain-containing protein [Candidatus Shapirobacteria bacterium]
MVKIYRLILLVCFFLLLLRLAQLTIVQGRDFRSQAEQNRIVKERLVAARGTIFDRNGKILAIDDPYCLYQGKEQDREECLRLRSLGEKVEWLFWRYYPLAEAGGHITGYLGQASREEVSSGQYQQDQLVGRGGVEEYYQSELAGWDGYRLSETDIKGEKIREIGEVASREGKSITLFIDSQIQKKAFSLLSGSLGAVVVSNPQNGEIIALASSPAFDPNLFVLKGNDQQIVSLLADGNQPFLNRAVSARFPPGSIFKLVSGLAGLEEGAIGVDTKIEDTGFIEVNNYRYANWYYTQYGKKDQNVDIVEAIKRSNDVFFYRLGERLGPEKLADWSERFFLNDLSGIDLPAEARGFVPSPKWKEEVVGEPWFLGNSFHFAIGQGDLAITPLMANLMTNFFANGGYFCRPRLANSLPVFCQEIVADDQNRELILSGMIAACRPGGTASVFFDFEINGRSNQVACKTGTAEFDIESKRTHAWFTAFAPLDKPIVSVTVFLQSGGGGAREAAPIAKEILKEFFAN